MQDKVFLGKVSIPSTIQTVTQRIAGDIHIREWQRVKDYLDNATERFLAVTNAKVYNFKGEVLHQFDFLAVNLEHVVWIHPEDAKKVIEEQDQPG